VGTPVNGRKPTGPAGLLRNSTIFAAQKLGLDQCSQKAPGGTGWLEQRPDGSPAFPQPLPHFDINPTSTPVSSLLLANSDVAISNRSEADVGQSPRKHQVTLGTFNQFGAFCEHCPSPKNCAAFFVELRSSRIG